MWIDEKGRGCENLMAGKSSLKGWLTNVLATRRSDSTQPRPGAAWRAIVLVDRKRNRSGGPANDCRNCAGVSVCETLSPVQRPFAMSLLCNGGLEIGRASCRESLEI